jgi:hypothetical protein
MLSRLKYWLFGSILLCRPVYADCTIDRYQDVASLHDLRGVLNPKMPEFDLERDSTIEERNIAQRNNKDFPISLSLDGSVDHNGETSTNNAELQLSYDLNFPLQSATKKRFEVYQKIYNLRLSNITLREDLYFLQQVLDWKYGQAQLKLIQRRLDILTQKVGFLEESDRRGGSVLSDLSSVRLEIVMQNSKILAIESRMNLAAISLEIQRIEALAINNLTWNPLYGSVECPLRSFEILLAQEDVHVAQIEKEISILENTVSASLRASQDLLDPDESPRLGLNFQLNIFSPQQRGRAVRRAATNYDQALRNLRLAHYRAEGLVREQTALEQLMFESIASIDGEIEARQNLLRELAIRAELGQTIFEQKNRTLLDLVELDEVRLQSVYDFYTGWFQFLEARGIE